MKLRYTVNDPKLAAKCVEHFVRTGELYPGTAWLIVKKGDILENEVKDEVGLSK